MLAIQRMGEAMPVNDIDISMDGKRPLAEFRRYFQLREARHSPLGSCHCPRPVDLTILQCEKYSFGRSNLPNLDRSVERISAH